MLYHDKRLQYPVRVETPDPLFARQLQQAIGGIEGEIRVCLQYFFQAWGAHAPNNKYRDLLLHTATEEMGHVEMLATAVALNLQDAPLTDQEDGAADKVVGAVMGGGSSKQVIEGMLQRHILSTGLAAYPANSDGVPFDCSHIYASGNIVADMYCNIAAEATGRTLAVRLYNSTSDPGMKDMLHFMIARDTMHQQQWLAVIEELGGNETLPVPNSFDQSKEHQQYSYFLMGTSRDGGAPPEGRFSSGPSIDGNGEFNSAHFEPLGEEPRLGPAREGSGAQSEQIGRMAAE
jgi:Mn-containing catalase